jgi:hypothetical protein
MLTEQYTDARKLLSNAKFYEGYSRFIPEENRYETWLEAVDRVMNMHKKYYANKITENPELINYINEATDAYHNKLVLGAQRALQFGGDQLLKHPMRLYNCVSSYADRPAFFGEVFYVLLCGAGAGFSTQFQHVKKLPKILPRTKQPKTHLVEDSIEGWATALDVLMSSFFEDGGKHPEFKGRKVYFDLSSIRPKGAMISGGFKAPGPDPLRRTLDRIEYLLTGLILNEKAATLRPIHVYDIVMHVADAVLSGGVRRAATICLFSVDDSEMMNAKTGNWFNDNPQRARSNNSAVIVRNKVTREQFAKIMESIKQFGEPGFFFVDDEDITTNPCVPDSAWIMTDKGPRQVKELIDTPFKAMVNGKSYSSNGFFKTGTKSVYKVKAKNGMEFEATDNHKVLTTIGWVEVKDLTSDHQLVINDNRNMSWGDASQKQFNEGWMLGEILGDGGYNPNKYPTYMRFWGETAQNLHKQAYDILREYEEVGSNLKENKEGDILTIESTHLTSLFTGLIEEGTKNILPALEEKSSSFIAGFIRGYFDADGTVAKNDQKGHSVRLASVNLHNLQSVQRMLARFGIISKIYRNRRVEGEYLLPDTNGDLKAYPCQESIELVIAKANIILFKDIIGFYDQNKQTKLMSLYDNEARGPYRETFTTHVESVNYVSIQDVYDCTVDEVHMFDSNGILIHNCVEIGMFPQYNGESGFQGCNLSEINGGACSDEETFYKACRAGAILGTLQAGYTDFKFMTASTKKIFEREALLGVSITGWMNNPDILFNDKILQKGAQIVKDVNKEVSALLGINQAARTTCAKPSGNASVLLMTASGIHADHSPLYIRNVQLNKETEVAKLIRKVNPNMVEESVWSAGKTDYVVSFPVIPKEGTIYKNELIGVKHLELVKLAQENWVNAGTNIDLCINKSVRHNISNTIIVDDWDEIEEYVFNNKEYFAGISFLAATGDKDYNQAPNTAVLNPVQIVEKYGPGAIFGSGLVVESLKVFDNLWVATSTALGYGEDIDADNHENNLKKEWIRRFDKFAENYFNGDKKLTEYCLKDVYILHKWEKIQQTMLDIDWSKELTSVSYTDIDTMGAAACSGPMGCEI